MALINAFTLHQQHLEWEALLPSNLIIRRLEILLSVASCSCACKVSRWIRSTCHEFSRICRNFISAQIVRIDPIYGTKPVMTRAHSALTLSL